MTSVMYNNIGSKRYYLIVFKCRELFRTAKNLLLVNSATKEDGFSQGLPIRYFANCIG